MDSNDDDLDSIQWSDIDADGDSAAAESISIREDESLSLGKRRTLKLDAAEWRSPKKTTSSPSSLASTRPASAVDSPNDVISSEAQPEDAQERKEPATLISRKESMRYTIKKPVSPLKKERERILKKYSPMKMFKRRLIVKSSVVKRLDRAIAESHEYGLKETKEEDGASAGYRKSAVNWKERTSRSSEDESRQDSDCPAEEDGDTNDLDEEHEKSDLDNRSPSQCVIHEADADEHHLLVRGQTRTNIFHKKRKRHQREAERLMNMLGEESESEACARREREAVELFAAAHRELGEEKMSCFTQILASSDLGPAAAFSRLHLLCAGFPELQEMLLDLLTCEEALSAGAHVYEAFLRRAEYKRFFRKLRRFHENQPSLHVRILKELSALAADATANSDTIKCLASRLFKANQHLKDSFLALIPNAPFPTSHLPDPEVLILKDIPASSSGLFSSAHPTGSSASSIMSTGVEVIKLSITSIT